MKIKHAVVLSALVFSFASGALAETSAELGLRYATVQQNNVDQLKQYTWQTDTKLSESGEAKVHVVLACRLNEKGEMAQEVVTAETTVKQKRGRRGRKQAAHAGDVGAFLNQVIATMATYIFMSKGQEVDFFDKATITEGAGDDAGKVIVQAGNVTVTGDKVTKWIDKESLFTVKITFTTVVDEVPVSGEVLYRPIENGPNVPRMSTVDIPSQKGVMETEFLKYEKQL